jgi:hypothetical protein
MLPLANARRDLIDDEIDALAAGCREHGVGPGGIARIDREIGAELGETRAPRGIGRGAD